MQNQIIISPSFIDRAVLQLAGLDLPGASINDPDRIGDGQQARASCVHRPLAEQAASATGAGKRPVSIAGDCCTAIAMVAGLQRGGIDATLIWLDAHGDFNTWQTSPSGFLGGMPLAMIAGCGDMTMPEAVGMQPLDENRIVLADGRDLDPEEAVAVKSSAMTHVTEFDQLVDMPLPDGPLYVHFDSDVIDCAEAPGHNYPVPGGPGAKTVNEVMQRLASTGRVAAASMSAWNPDLDLDGRTAKICMDAFRLLIDER
ncbi:MAG: arginase family protein [Aestuariivirgaceae bacterium]